MPMLDPFKADGYSVLELTAAINALPNNWGRIRMSGLFRTKSVSSRTVGVEHRDGVLNLLQTQPVGSPGTTDRRAKRKLRDFRIPHIPHDGELLPDEYDGIRAFGTDSDVSAPDQILNDRLGDMRAKHEITLEHLMVGALHGKVLDADASTIFNYFTEFDITEKVVDFVLGTGTTDIEKKCREVIRHCEKNLKGEVMTAVKAYVDESFFDKLIAHAKVRETYINWVAAENLRNGQAVGRDNVGTFVRQFPYGGMIFEEYQGTATDAAGTDRKFFATDTGRAFPVGTLSTFAVYYAPADFVETVNTLGKPMYAKMEPRKFGRGYDIHTQSNPLPMCHRPEVLVKVHTSN